MGASTVRQWVVHFIHDNSDVKYKPRSGRPLRSCHTMKQRALQSAISASQWIMTRELCMELNIGFSALETVVVMLEYHKVCTRWVPQMLTQEIQRVLAELSYHTHCTVQIWHIL